MRIVLATLALTACAVATTEPPVNWQPVPENADSLRQIVNATLPRGCRATDVVVRNETLHYRYVCD